MKIKGSKFLKRAAAATAFAVALAPILASADEMEAVKAASGSCFEQTNSGGRGSSGSNCPNMPGSRSGAGETGAIIYANFTQPKPALPAGSAGNMSGSTGNLAASAGASSSTGSQGATGGVPSPDESNGQESTPANTSFWGRLKSDVARLTSDIKSGYASAVARVKKTTQDVVNDIKKLGVSGGAVAVFAGMVGGALLVATGPIGVGAVVMGASFVGAIAVGKLLSTIPAPAPPASPGH